jgi:hypothetical protein
MSSTKSKVFTAQVGCKTVTATFIGEALYADDFNGAAYVSKDGKRGYKVFSSFKQDGFVFESVGHAKTQFAAVDLFFSEMRIAAAQIAAETPPSDLFQDDQAREDHELNQYEHTKADWDC